MILRKIFRFPPRWPLALFRPEKAASALLADSELKWCSRGLRRKKECDTGQFWHKISGFKTRGILAA